MKILALGAHPDDVEFAMGGTLIKLSKEGHEISMVVLTRGEAGTRGTPEIREKEMRAAAEYVGATLEILDFVDTEIEDTAASRKKIATIVRKHKPDMVFAPYHTNPLDHRDGMAHPDHLALGNIARHALRFAKFRNLRLSHSEHLAKHLVYYMIPRHTKPTIVCDISKYYREWVKLVKFHASQLKPGLLEHLSLWRMYVGSMIGVKYGEPFIIEEPIPFDITILR